MLKNEVVVDYSERVHFAKQQLNGYVVHCKELSATYYGMNEKLYPRNEVNGSSYVLKKVDDISEDLETDGSWIYDFNLGKCIRSEDLKGELVREQRDKLLTATDWAISLDSPLEGAVQDLVKKYRQELRDIPQQELFPFGVVFPVSPLELVPEATGSLSETLNNIENEI